MKKGRRRFTLSLFKHHHRIPILFLLLDLEKTYKTGWQTVQGRKHVTDTKIFLGVKRFFLESKDFLEGVKHFFLEGIKQFLKEANIFWTEEMIKHGLLLLLIVVDCCSSNRSRSLTGYHQALHQALHRIPHSSC